MENITLLVCKAKVDPEMLDEQSAAMFPLWKLCYGILAHRVWKGIGEWEWNIPTGGHFLALTRNSFLRQLSKNFLSGGVPVELACLGAGHRRV